jgi:hypothetical protein
MNNSYTTPQKLGLAISILGFLAGGGTQLTDILSPLGSIAPTIVKEIVSLSGFVSGVLGIILATLTSQTGAVKAVVEMAKDPTSPIQGVITTATPEGKALASSIPGPINTAGGTGAAELAKA